MPTPLSVITIDGPGTRRFEDGVYINPETKEISIVSIVPDFSRCNFEKVAKALQEQHPRKNPNDYFFDPRLRGLKRLEPTPVFVYTSSPPYETATFSLGEAVFSKNYTFEEFSRAMEQGKDEQVLLLCEYAEYHECDTLPSDKIVSLLMRQLNDAAIGAFKKTEIPYLSHAKGGISTVEGKPRINRPFRDAVSCIDAAQLAHYLRGERAPFSRNELREIISQKAR